MDKRGTQIISLWWFSVLAFVTVVVVIATVMFYGKPVDVREIEADVLSDRIARCIYNQELLNVSEIRGLKLYQDCGLREKSFGLESNFYFNVTFYDSLSKVQIWEFIGGKRSYAGDCIATGKDIKAEHYPKCVNQAYPVVYLDGGVRREGVMVITTGSNQGGLREVGANGEI